MDFVKVVFFVRLILRGGGLALAGGFWPVVLVGGFWRGGGGVKQGGFGWWVFVREVFGGGFS